MRFAVSLHFESCVPLMVFSFFLFPLLKTKVQSLSTVHLLSSSFDHIINYSHFQSAIPELTSLHSSGLVKRPDHKISSPSTITSEMNLEMFYITKAFVA